MRLGYSQFFVTATKGVLFAALPFLAFAYSAKIVDLAGQFSFSQRHAWFVLGCVIFVPSWWLCNRYFRNPWEFICTLEHELTHAIVGLPFLFIPSDMRVTATRGGHVKQIWIGPAWLIPLYGPGEILSTLAPYFLPTVSYLLVGLSFFIDQMKSPWFFIILGVMTAFHVASTWSETRYRQPDIQRAGIVFSTVFLPVANLIVLGGLLAFITGGTKGFWEFWIDGLSRAISVFQFVLGLAKR